MTFIEKLKNIIIDKTLSTDKKVEKIAEHVYNNAPIGATCNVKGCCEPPINKSNWNGITDLELDYPEVQKELDWPGFWSRFGFTQRFCKKHYLEALESFYNIKRDKVMKLKDGEKL